MRKWMAVLALLSVMAFALPVSAQDAACPGDMTAIIEALSADYESPEDALRAIIEARTALQTFETQCARAGVVLLDNAYTPEGGTFTLNYPNGWQEGIFSPSETGGVLFLGNTAFAQRLLQSEQPIPAQGEMGLQILIGTPTDREDASGLQSIVTDFEVLLRGLYPDSSVTEYFTLDGREAARLSFRGQAFDGFLIALALDGGRFVAIRGVTSTGELDALQNVAQAVAVSVR